MKSSRFTPIILEEGYQEHFYFTLSQIFLESSYETYFIGWWVTYLHHYQHYPYDWYTVRHYYSLILVHENICVLKGITLTRYHNTHDYSITYILQIES